MFEVQTKKPIRIRFYESSDPFYRVIAKKFRKHLLAQKESRYANKQVHFKALFWFCTFLFFYYVGLTSKISFVVIFAFYFSLSSWFFLTLNVGHDAAHGCYFDNSRANYWALTLLFGVLGVNGYHWRLRHISAHHPFPNVANCDCDIDESFLLRFSPHNKKRWFHEYQHYYALPLYYFATIHAVWLQDWQHLFRRKLANLQNISTPPNEIVIFLAGKAAHLTLWLLIPMQFHSFTFWQALLNYLLFTGLSSFCFLPVALTHLNDVSSHQKADSQGELQASFGLHQIQTSIDWCPQNAVASFFYGGLNSHAAHHLFPNVSHRHYHKITSLIDVETRSFGLTYQSFSFIEALRSHFRYLKKIGGMP